LKNNLVGIKNLQVEIDAKFIRGMFNEPDLQPNAAMNRWIQGILLFDFNLVHVPASHFAGPDALSRRLPASQEEYVSDNATWMDNTFLLSLVPNREEFKDFCFTTPTVLPLMYMPLSSQYRYIVAAKDDLTGVTEASPLRKNNSKTLAKFLWQKIYCRYGAIGQVTTDNGPEVKGAFGELVRRMGIPHVTISPYNKHANGVVELS
jgi:transposase InsO family protein